MKSEKEQDEGEQLSKMKETKWKQSKICILVNEEEDTSFLSILVSSINHLTG